MIARQTTPPTPPSGNTIHCVILAGGLHPSPLQRACDVSVLSLAIAPGRSVLDELVAIAYAAVDRVIPIHVVYGDPTPAPTAPSNVSGASVTIVREPRRWRGPAGTLRDVCDDIPNDAHVLVLEGARWFGASLRGLVHEHLASGADLTVLQTSRREPAGAMMIRRSALDLAPKNGFFDLKEQLIGRLIADGRPARVSTLPPPGSAAIRTLTDLLDAARRATCGGGDDGLLAHNHAWSLIDPRANVDQSALIIGSIIMAGARVESSAVVARSIVLPGGIVQSSDEVVEAVVGPRGVVWVSSTNRSDEPVVKGRRSR